MNAIYIHLSKSVWELFLCRSSFLLQNSCFPKCYKWWNEKKACVRCITCFGNVYKRSWKPREPVKRAFLWILLQRNMKHSRNSFFCTARLIYWLLSFSTISRGAFTTWEPQHMLPFLFALCFVTIKWYVLLLLAKCK